jgi:hypothetical protein
LINSVVFSDDRFLACSGAQKTMMPAKIILTLWLLFVTVELCRAQEIAPAPSLFDAYGEANCEMASARMDNFMYGLDKLPDSMGYAIIYPKKGGSKDAIWQEDRIKGSIYFRKFNKDRIRIVRGEERDDLAVQYWIVPRGAEAPKFIESRWPEQVVDLSKPFIYFYFDMGYGICASDLEKTYIDLLASHPEMRGHIVFYNFSKKDGREETEIWLKSFTEDGRVGRDRFKIFFAKGKLYQASEFWIVPPKKKK